jgi:hypothetical protein
MRYPSLSLDGLKHTDTQQGRCFSDVDQARRPAQRDLLLTVLTARVQRRPQAPAGGPHRCKTDETHARRKIATKHQQSTNSRQPAREAPCLRRQAHAVCQTWISHSVLHSGVSLLLTVLNMSVKRTPFPNPKAPAIGPHRSKSDEIPRTGRT